MKTYDFYIILSYAAAAALWGGMTVSSLLAMWRAQKNLARYKNQNIK